MIFLFSIDDGKTQFISMYVFQILINPNWKKDKLSMCVCI